MIDSLIAGSLTTPREWFQLFIVIVLLGLFCGLAYWVLKTFILPNVPEPFRWVINILIGLALLGLLIFIFF